MVNIFISLTVLLFSIAFSFEVETKSGKEYLKLVFKNINKIEEVPFFDNSFYVISIKGVDKIRLPNLKNEFVKDINIIKTTNSIKLAFELNKKNIAKNLVKRKNYIELIFSLTPKKNKFSQQKIKPVKAKKKTKRINHSKNILKAQSKTHYDYKIKPIKRTKLTYDPLYSLIVKNLTPEHKLPYARKKIIVIDPGHGGIDPGAIANGLVEKDINLKIAKKLKKYLEKDGRFKVYLTRNKDKFVDLYSRTVFAIRKKADLFISIHCNADKNGTGSGTYIYTLSNKGARLKLTKLVAARENKVVLKHVRVSNNWYVNKIVAELAINTTMTEGLNFAYILKKKLKYIADFKDIDSANFAVLKTPGIPSVLIETAYVTNKKDAKLLKNPVFLENFTAAIYTSIVDYFYKYQNVVYKR